MFSVTPNTGSSCLTNSLPSFSVKYVKNAHANLLSTATYSDGGKRQQGASQARCCFLFLKKGQAEFIHISAWNPNDLLFSN